MSKFALVICSITDRFIYHCNLFSLSLKQALKTCQMNWSLNVRAYFCFQKKTSVMNLGLSDQRFSVHSCERWLWAHNSSLWHCKSEVTLVPWVYKGVRGIWDPIRDLSERDLSVPCEQTFSLFLFFTWPCLRHHTQFCCEHGFQTGLESKPNSSQSHDFWSKSTSFLFQMQLHAKQTAHEAQRCF